MKMLTGIVFPFLFLGIPALSQISRDTAYMYTYGGKQNDVCNQIKPTPDKGYMLFGTTNSFGNGYSNFYALKIDSNCRYQWSRAYGGSQLQAGYSFTPTSDKGYAFAGYTNSYGKGGYDAYLVKTDSLGTVQWEKTFGGSDWDFAYSVKQLHDGGFVLCGQTYSFGSGGGDAYLIRTDKNGDTLWTRTFGGPGNEVANSVLVQGDTLITLAGSTTSFGKGDTNMLFLQTDGNGTLRNTRTFGCSHSSVAYSISPTSDRGFILMGSMDSITPNIRSQMLIKTDSVGNFQWLLQPGPSTYQDIGKDVIEYPDKTFLCVSAANGGGYGSSSLLATHYDHSGGWLAGPSYGGNNN